MLLIKTLIGCWRAAIPRTSDVGKDQAAASNHIYPERRWTAGPIVFVFKMRAIITGRKLSPQKKLPFNKPIRNKWNIFKLKKTNKIVYGIYIQKI